jgi:hypothetical protein
MTLHRILTLIFAGLLTAQSNLTLAETGSAVFEKAMSSSDFQIVPNEKRIGPIRIGMPLDEVIKLLGRPEKIPPEPRGFPGFMYYYDEHAFHIGFTGGVVPRVNSITVWDTRFALENGKHIGHFTSFDVVRWYPNARPLGNYQVHVALSDAEVTFYIKGQGDYTVNVVEIE